MKMMRSLGNITISMVGKDYRLTKLHRSDHQRMNMLIIFGIAAGCILAERFGDGVAAVNAGGQE